jgi:glutathione S-transferase
VREATMKLYGHPFSSYTQKALIAFYENDIAFESRVIGPDDPAAGEELAALWPLEKFPVLVDGDAVVLEASIIIEHLDQNHPGRSRLIPAAPTEALTARMLDRVFDNYVMTPVQAMVGDRLRPEASRDPYGVDQARAKLETVYAWLDGLMAERTWATGRDFSLADCAAAPSLFYADWAHPIGNRFGHLRDYRARLLARPSFARAVDEARPYRAFFPLGAPDRD